MTHDVFISYPSQNKPLADAICAKLESNNIRTWIAPRDILPGQNYAEALLHAIDSCKIFVLVFSDNTNKSPHIMSEVQRAFNNNRIIIPFRVENIEPSTALEYYIGNAHWLDAITPPAGSQIDKLVRVVKANLDQPAEDLIPDTPHKRFIEEPAPKKMPMMYVYGAAILALLVICAALVFIVATPEQSPAKTSATPVTTVPTTISTPVPTPNQTQQATASLTPTQVQETLTPQPTAPPQEPAQYSGVSSDTGYHNQAIPERAKTVPSPAPTQYSGVFQTPEYHNQAIPERTTTVPTLVPTQYPGAYQTQDYSGQGTPTVVTTVPTLVQTTYPGAYQTQDYRNQTTPTVVTTVPTPVQTTYPGAYQTQDYRNQTTPTVVTTVPTLVQTAYPGAYQTQDYRNQTTPVTTTPTLNQTLHATVSPTPDYKNQTAPATTVQKSVASPAVSGQNNTSSSNPYAIQYGISGEPPVETSKGWQIPDSSNKGNTTQSYVWAQFGNMKNGDIIRIDWLSPDGIVRGSKEGKWNKTASSAWWWTAPPQDTKNQESWSTYTVHGYVNDQMVFTDAYRPAT